MFNDSHFLTGVKDGGSMDAVVSGAAVFKRLTLR